MVGVPERCMVGYHHRIYVLAFEGLHCDIRDLRAVLTEGREATTDLGHEGGHIRRRHVSQRQVVVVIQQDVDVGALFITVIFTELDHMDIEIRQRDRIRLRDFHHRRNE